MTPLRRVEGIWFCELTDDEVWQITDADKVVAGRSVELPDYRARLRGVDLLRSKVGTFLSRIDRSARLAEMLNAELDAARVSASMGVPVDDIDAIRAHVAGLKTLLESDG